MTQTQPFGDYAAAYDLLYADKDYAAEAAFVLDRAAALRGAPVASAIDFGCGSARHAMALAASGVAVAGVERSAGMIACARRNLARAKPEIAARVTVEAGDARDFRSDMRADLVTLLFHVMSYQTSDADVLAALATARAHAAPDGVVLFDYWHLPAVIADPPTVREREAEDETFRIRRRSVPSALGGGVVRIGFELDICTKATGATQRIDETHVMRAFTTAEIAAFCARAGLQVVHQAEFLTDRPADATAFGVYAACRPA